jgi:glycosyltransferase involved in cell wall biosynthesis
MTRVVLFDSSWKTYGGGEKFVCAIADALSGVEGYDVTLLLDSPQVTFDELRRRFNVRLDRTTCRYVKRGEVRSALHSADIGIVTSNVFPFGNHARKNVYILQMPFRRFAPLPILRRALTEGPRAAAKDLLRLSLLRDARRASLVLMYSEFCCQQLERAHHLRAQVLYPPIDDFAGQLPKERIILSVGRFFRGLYNDKRYDILITAFKQLCQRLPDRTWEYHLVGSCGSDRASRAFLSWLEKASRDFPIRIHVNASYDELKQHYQRATFFWHAAGYGIDEDSYPDRTEHFGMSTVEAMSAGCIPLVANAGGQKEIVSHGKSGYLWNTVDELIGQTLDVMQNPERVPLMQHEARKRFTDFSPEKFARHVLSLFQHITLTTHGKN